MERRFFSGSLFFLGKKSNWAAVCRNPPLFPQTSISFTYVPVRLWVPFVSESSDVSALILFLISSPKYYLRVACFFSSRTATFDSSTPSFFDSSSYSKTWRQISCPALQYCVWAHSLICRLDRVRISKKAEGPRMASTIYDVCQL